MKSETPSGLKGAKQHLHIERDLGDPEVSRCQLLWSCQRSKLVGGCVHYCDLSIATSVADVADPFYPMSNWKCSKVDWYHCLRSKEWSKSSINQSRKSTQLQLISFFLSSREAKIWHSCMSLVSLGKEGNFNCQYESFGWGQMWSVYFLHWNKDRLWQW